jgi:hypothetical protein
MELLRIDLTKRGFTSDCEFFDTARANTLNEFAEILFDDEIEYIRESSHDNEEILDRSDVIEYWVYDSYMEFVYDGGIISRFYLVNHEDSVDLVEAARIDILEASYSYHTVDTVLQKIYEKS